MTMERVCVYQDKDAINQSINWIETVLKHLQDLSDKLSETEIVPTLEKLQSLYDGSNLWDMITESCKNQGISRMPKRVQDIVRNDTAKDVEKLRFLALNLIHTDVATIEWDLYQVNDGKVNMAPGYKQVVTDRNSIYIDTDTRAAVYEKWLAMEKAIKEFNQAVVEAPKKNSFYDSMVKIDHPMACIYDPQLLRGIGVPDTFSLARLDPDGSVILKGRNFKYLK